MCAAVEKYGMSMEQHEYTKKNIERVNTLILLTETITEN